MSDVNLILGRCFRDSPVDISTLEANEELVAIRGKVSHLKQRVINGGAVLLLTFIITDRTSSILCRCFLSYQYSASGSKNGISSPLDEERQRAQEKYNRLKRCRFAIARGECIFDRHHQRLSMIIRDLLEAREETDHEL